MSKTFTESLELGSNSLVEFQSSYETQDYPFVEADHKIPSISPRDRLSYIEDKVFWKQMRKFELDSTYLSKLIMLMKMEIITKKPDNIVDFLVDEFFSEKNQMELRKNIVD